MPNRPNQSTPSARDDQALADRITRLLDGGVHPVKIHTDLEAEFGPEAVTSALLSLQYLRNRGVATRPEHRTDLDGLRTVVGLTGWEVRWNATARRPEARPAGGEWESCEAGTLTRDRLMTACERAATSRGEGWQIRGVSRESRLLHVLAGERTEAGDGNAEYAATVEWLRSPRPAHMRLQDVFSGAGLLQKYERPARAPKHVQADVRQALIDSGWRERSVRLKTGPRRRWCRPAGLAESPRVSLRPSSFRPG